MSLLDFPVPRHAAAALLALCASMPLSAQTLHLLQSAPLRADHSPDAPALANLAAGQGVSLLRMSGGWVQVQAASVQGWLRASQLDLAGAEVAAASQLDTGRRAPGATAVMLGVRALPPRSTRHALIIGVSNYEADPQRPVTPLAGVPQDVLSAMAIAHLLQVPDNNITVLRDGAATREGVQQALRELNDRMQPGDRVFFYWSGHGSRYFDPVADGCVETLVPYDLHDIGNHDFAKWFQPLAAKADKMFVVYDACHSGGVDGTSSIATRSFASGYLPKSAPGEGACLKNSNLRTRGLESATQALGLSSQDIVHISAARPDEVAYDNVAFGGVATSSLLECLRGDARDLDGSGSISVEDIAVCAQAKMENKLRPFPLLQSSHLVVSGNRAFVPAWFAGDPAPHVTAPAVTPTPQALPPEQPQGGAAASTVLQTPVVAIPSPPDTPVSASVQTVLEQIHAQRDSKRRVEVTLASKGLRIGADTLDFSVTSDHDGYVYVAMLGSDRKSLYLLFPNDLDTNNHIAAGESMLLPRRAWRIAAGGPKGKDSLLVMVTDGPRDVSALAGGKAGPFAKPLTDARGRTQLQWLLGQRSQESLEGCHGAGCSDAFGSTLLNVDEY